MKIIVRILLLPSLLLLLSACNGMPKLFWDDEDGPAYAGGSGNEEGQMPLDVPPPLFEKTSSDTDSSQVSAGYKQAVAGKAVALNVREYAVDAATLFSAVEKALVSLDIPLTSVDMPSGIVITDWVKKTPEDSGMFANLMGDSSPRAIRHRYIVRVFRLEGAGENSRLEVRTLNQEYRSIRWVNTSKHSAEGVGLFSEVERQIGRPQQEVRPQ